MCRVASWLFGSNKSRFRRPQETKLPNLLTLQYYIYVTVYVLLNISERGLYVQSKTLPTFSKIGRGK